MRHYSFSVRIVFHFILNIFPSGHRGKNTLPPTFIHHAPVQKKRRPVCHQYTNVRKKAAVLYLHSELSRAQGAGRIGIPPDEVRIPHVVL